MYVVRSFRKKVIGVHTSFDVTYLPVPLLPRDRFDTLNNGCPVLRFGHCIEAGGAAGAVKEGTHSGQFGIMLLPSMALFIPYQAQRYYTTTPLSTGKRNIHAYYAIFKTVILGNGDHLVSSSFLTLYKHKLQRPRMVKRERINKKHGRLKYSSYDELWGIVCNRVK